MEPPVDSGHSVGSGPAGAPVAPKPSLYDRPVSPPDSTANAQELFERYVIPEVDVMYRVAMSLTRNRADAEDLVQDTMVRAFRAIERFDGRYPRAWLLTILRNAQLNRVRRRRPELLRDPDTTMERVADTSDSATDVEAAVVDVTFDARVEEAYRRLPDKFRSVVELVDLGSLTYQEAADVLDVPVGTVMSRLHRARNRIKKDLQKVGITSPRID